jgi:outer membrane protein TolC
LSDSNIGQNTSKDTLVANQVRLAEQALEAMKVNYEMGYATQADVDAAQAKLDQAHATETK